jgi:hypothetical protein
MTVQRVSLLACAMLCLLAGCQKDSLLDRSLIFSTHTTFGLEVSLQPTDAATTPVSIVIGYKRTDGVLNPVYHSEGIETPDVERTTSNETQPAETPGPGTVGPNPSADGKPPQAGVVPVSTPPTRLVQTTERTGRRPRYRQDAYSVLAKFQGGAEGKVKESAEAGMSIAEWFATGAAADILARQPGIAGAISGSSKIGEAAALEAGARKLSVRAASSAETVLSCVYDGLKALAPEDPRAKSYIAGLDSLAALTPPGVMCFSRDPDGLVKCAKMDCFTDTPDFRSYLTYRASLKGSITTLEKALAGQTFKYQPLNANARDASPEDKTRLQSFVTAYKAAREQLDATVKKSPQYADAIAYYADILAGEGR